MPTAGIMMCPVDDTAFRVPFVLTEKFNGVAFSKGIDTLSNINVVSDKNSLTRG